MLTPNGLHPYLDVAHAPRPCSMMPRATVWVKKIPVQLEVEVVERAVVLEERPGDEESGGVDQQGRVGVLVGQLPPTTSLWPAKFAVVPSVPLVAAHGQLCWLHTSKPGRPARLAHRQIRYLLESVGSGETGCAKANVESDPLLRAAAAA